MLRRTALPTVRCIILSGARDDGTWPEARFGGKKTQPKQDEPDERAEDEDVEDLEDLED